MPSAKGVCVIIIIINNSITSLPIGSVCGVIFIIVGSELDNPSLNPVTKDYY